MPRSIARRAKPAKSEVCRIRNPKVEKPGQLDAVMQRVQKSLGTRKPAPTLAFLTDQPLSNCQKVLAGNRLPNPAMLVALFRDELIIDAILGLIPDDANHPKVRAVRRAIRRLEIDFEDER